MELVDAAEVEEEALQTSNLMIVPLCLLEHRRVRVQCLQALQRLLPVLVAFVNRRLGLAPTLFFIVPCSLAYLTPLPCFPRLRRLQVVTSVPSLFPVFRLPSEVHPHPLLLHRVRRPVL